MILVVDSSVLVKAFVVEQESEIVDSIVLSSFDLHAPDLIFAEIANVLWRRWRMNQMGLGDIDRAIDDLPALLTGVHSLASLVKAASSISVMIDHPVDDCCHLVLADRLAAPFVTADLRLLRKVQSTKWQDAALTIADGRTMITR